MSDSQGETATDPELLQLTLDIWHPNCWTLDTTATTGAGLLGYGTTKLSNDAGRVGYYTVFGDSGATIDEFFGLIRDSELVTDTINHTPGPDIAPVSRNV